MAMMVRAELHRLGRSMPLLRRGVKRAFTTLLKKQLPALFASCMQHRATETTGEGANPAPCASIGPLTILAPAHPLGMHGAGERERSSIDWEAARAVLGLISVLFCSVPPLWSSVSSGFCTNHPENHRGTEGTEDAQRSRKRRQVARALLETCRCQRDLRSPGAGPGEKSRPKSSPLCADECVRRFPSFRWLLCAASVPAHFGLGLCGSLAESCRKLSSVVSLAALRSSPDAQSRHET